jgi:antitoxin component YwqK of YwqJK toxin-antitoxin module
MNKTYKVIKTYRKNLGPEGSKLAEEEIKEILISETEYDNSKNIVKDIAFNPDGNIDHRYEYIYNENGKVSEEILYYENNEVADRKKYEYDEKGNVIKELVFYEDETYDTIHYSYNAEMNLIEKTTLSYEGETDEKEIFEYSKGKMILNAIFDGEKKKFYETTYKYNEAGKVTEVTEWDSDTNKKTRTESTYDANGNLVKQLRFADETLIAKMIFTIDENSRVSQVNDEDVNHKNTIKLLYDEKGNMIEETEYNFKNELNHKITRTSNEHNDVLISHVYVDPHNGGITQNYIIRYEYLS